MGKKTIRHEQRATTVEPRHLFTPLPDPNKSTVQKGKEFENYFKEGVKKADIPATVTVKHQKKVDITPG